MVVELLAQRSAGLDRRARPATAKARADALKAAELAAGCSLPACSTMPGWPAAAGGGAAGPRRHPGAEEAVTAAGGVDRSTSATSLAIRLHTRLVSSRIAFATGRRSTGLTQIRRGLDDLANFQSRFGSQDLQSAASIHGRELGRLGLSTAVAAGSPAAILQWLERSRAASTRLPAVRPPADPVLADELGALRVADEQARAALLAGKRDHAAERRVTDLRRRVRARSWTVSGSGRADRPPTLTAVRRLLAERRPDAGVVALFVLSGKVHALVVTPQRAAHLMLAEWAAVQGYRQRLQSDLDLLADERIPRGSRRWPRGRWLRRWAGCPTPSHRCWGSSDRVRR